MKNETFYLAGPSALRAEMHEKGEVLTRYPYFSWWVGSWDWTTFLPHDHEDLSENKTRLASAGVVLGDLLAAQTADCFVLWCSQEHPSLGAHMELGARLAVGRSAFVVLNGCDHLFYYHPLITRVDTWRELLERLVSA